MESNDRSFAIKAGGGSTPGRPSKSIPVDAIAARLREANQRHNRGGHPNFGVIRSKVFNRRQRQDAIADAPRPDDQSS